MNKDKQKCQPIHNDNKKIIIYKSELDYLSKCILESPQIETGGNLFGLWTPFGIPLIHYVVGPGPIPISHNTRSHTSYRRSLWSRFDNFISDIGNWFADTSESITSVLSILLLVCMAIPFIGWLISLGWFWGIIAGIFLGGIAYYAAMIVVGIFIWISNIGLGIIRYIFYSGTTFLITLTIVGLLSGISFLSSLNDYTKYPAKSEYATSLTTRYYCTARSVLNVRSAPNLNARVIGVLKPNQTVDVYEIVNGFARIKYNGSDGYASIKYLNKQ